MNSIAPVASPVVNPSLGSDLSGITDLTPTMAQVSGRTCLAQSLCRRLITPRGRLIYDPNYGYDLTGFINDDLLTSDISTIQNNIVAECKKDPRVSAAKSVVQFVGPSQVAAAQAGVVANPSPIPTGVLVVQLTITDSIGPFALVLAASDVTVSLLSVSP
jgi:phage baseplate assembly protein W